MSEINDNELFENGTQTTEMKNIEKVYIEDEIKSSYLDYSMSVIV